MARAKEFDPDKALAKVLETFWLYGYEATSMQMLVQATGLSRSSLYDTFGDKRQLYVAALGRYREQTEISVEEKRPFSPTKIISDRFQGIVDEARVKGSNGCFVVNTAVELGQHDSELCTTVQDSFINSEEWFFDLLEKGKVAGELSSELNTRAVARFLLNASCGLQVLVKANHEPEMMQDAVNIILSILK